MSDILAPIDLEEQKFLRHARAFLAHFFKETIIPTLNSRAYNQETHLLSKNTLYDLLNQALTTAYLWKGARDVTRDFETIVSDAINGFNNNLLELHRLNLSYSEKRDLGLFCDKMRAELAGYLRLEQRERAHREATKQKHRNTSSPQNETGGDLVPIDFKRRQRLR
jgi:hypothetical protein